MLKLAKYLKNYKKEVFLGPAFKLTEAIFELIVPLIMAKIIDIGVANADSWYVLKMGGLILFLGAVGLVCALICQYYASVASQGFGTVLRNELFSKINALSHKELDRFGAPSLITRMTSDINQLQLAVAMLIRLVVRAPFLGVGAVVMAMIVDFNLSLIFLISTPLIIFVLYLITWKSVPLYRAIQKKLDRVSLMANENLGGARVIRAFSKQKEQEEAFSFACGDLKDSAVRVGRLSALLNPLTFIIVNFAIIAILWFGSSVTGEPALRGDMIALVNYMTQTLLAFIVVINLAVIFTKAAASAERVMEVLETDVSVKQAGDAEALVSKNAPKIEFQNVSFSYHESGKNSLSDISVKIMPGETVGIIGGTGAGKTTFANLILRFYDVTEGAVFVDGVNVKDLSFSKLRGQIGLVPQNAALFSGTIAGNLRLGKPDPTDEEIKKALGIAQALEFVERLPERFQSVVEEGGKNLSGGQKQRLAIARAIMKEPEILILDDSASALDFATDLKLRQAIKTGTKEITVILISQRVSTVSSSDKIIVLDNGGIAGIGTHEELLAGCGLYKEICMSQAGEKR